MFNSKNKQQDSNYKKNTSEAMYKGFLNKQPNFFNRGFTAMSNIVSYIMGFYILLTTSFYIIVHFNIANLFKSKSVLLEYDAALYSNLVVNLFFGVSILINIYSSKSKSVLMYSMIPTLMTIVYYSTITSISTKDFILFELLQLLKLGVIGIIVVSIIYIIYFYSANLNYLRTYLSDHFTFEEVYHEISLRTDMFKFAYNNFIIRTKLHKVFPGLVYKKDSFYYLSLSQKDMKKYQNNARTNLLEDSDSVSIQLNLEDEKKKLISKGLSSLSTMGEY
jgi:hypothetical protein